MKRPGKTQNILILLICIRVWSRLIFGKRFLGMERNIGVKNKNRNIQIIYIKEKNSANVFNQRKWQLRGKSMEIRRK